MLESILYKTVAIAVIFGVIRGAHVVAKHMATSANWKPWSWGLRVWAGALFASTFVGDMLASDHRSDCEVEWPGAVGLPPETLEGQLLTACRNQNQVEWWGFVVAMGVMTGLNTATGIQAGRLLHKTGKVEIAGRG